VSSHHDQVTLGLLRAPEDLFGRETIPELGLYWVLEVWAIDSIADCVEGMLVVSGVQVRRQRSFTVDGESGDMEDDQPGAVISGE